MIRLLNYGHPITDAQHADLERAYDDEEITVTRIPCHMDKEAQFAPQVVALVDAANLTPQQWQGERVIINAPPYAPAAALLLAELHGRMGYLPAVLRLRAADVSPPRFDVAEVMDLRKQRMSARGRR